MEHSVRKSFGLTISALGLIQFILFLYLFLTQFLSEFMRSSWISDWRTTAFILPLFFFFKRTLYCLPKETFINATFTLCSDFFNRTARFLTATLVNSYRDHIPS